MTSSVPLFLAGLPVIAWTTLDPLHHPTGRQLRRGGERVLIAGLAICRESEASFYLFGCDDAWNTVADTWHQTVDDAQHQAESQYRVTSHAWNPGG